MQPTLPGIYDALILRRPALALMVIVLVVGFACLHVQDFRLDASADSLLLENDQALHYYRSIRARYGADDSLVVTYTPDREIFSPEVLADIQQLRDRIAVLARVESVISLLDVPLISSPPVTLAELRVHARTLSDPDMDISLARNELIYSPLYRNLVISPDGKTTALQINFRHDEIYHRLLNERDRLREKHLVDTLSDAETDKLSRVSQQFNEYSAGLLDQQARDITDIRAILDDHRQQAKLYLGGLPMIVADSIDFIRHDMVTFGVGVLGFLVVILAVAFHKLRWIFLPMFTCLAAGLFMIGFLGWVDWPVTVVSSNFISLMLIITLSLTIHLIVRYRELHASKPAAGQRALVLETVRKKAMPCFYTAITTMVAFGSLLFSDIRPVIDFGLMMAIGIAVSFILAFTLVPASLVFMRPGKPSKSRNLTAAITRCFAHLIEHYRTTVTIMFVVIVVLSLLGISKLTVENRFIDYFKESTEIYRGMELIDRELGGTMPLEVVIDAPQSFFERDDMLEEDLFMDEFELESGSVGITGTSYWFNTYRLETVDAIHDYLDGLPETGKVLSVTTTIRMLKSLKDNTSMDDFFLAILYKKLPEDIKAALFSPYLSEDGNQLRFSIRVFESDPTLKRDELIQRIRAYLTADMGLEDSQVHVTGMLVLYNNMLQSLFRSQILTLGVVFLAIMLMFIISFRSLKMAGLAIIPNLVAAVQVLGLMGWLNIPLDIMTITIAAIVIGIAVDNTIHYIHRFKLEFVKDRDYWATVERCHDSIGRAMYYTTITITLGFMILALSNFVPTIYFGLLTGFSMLVALLADLTLLPLLLVWFRPLGADRA